ncbi:MAG: hypothetical protein ABIH00_09650 [Armatimonadota bacterium]
MKKLLVLFMVFFFCFLCFSACFAAKQPPPPDYFPLKVGYWWKYKTVEKGYEFTLKVTGTEKINDVECYKMETIVKMGDSEKTTVVEYYHKTNDFVYVYKQFYPANSMEVVFETPKKYLANPMKTGDKWDWKDRGMMGVDIEEDSVVEKTDTVKVPAFPKGIGTMNVFTKVLQGGQDVKKSYWYANGVGLVKSFTDSGSFQSTAELIEYNLKVK